MNRWVIGSDGFIAKRLLQNTDAAYTIKKVSPQLDKDSIYLDLLEPEKFEYDLIQKDDEIVFLAAISSPDLCDNQTEHAYAVNVKGTSHFIEKALYRQAKVLFFSSDTVYGRRNQIVNELSLTNPLGNYAKMKREVELKFLDRENFKVFRLSYVFSKDDKFTKYICQCSEKGQAAEIFHPFYRNIVFIEDLIDAIGLMFQNWEQTKSKVVNICGNESLSRVDLAAYYEELVNDSFNFTVTEPPPAYFEARPQVIQMSSLYLPDLLGRDPMKIKEAVLREFGINKLR